MKRMTESGERCLTVLANKSIAKGTLNDAMTKVSLSTGLPKQDLLSRLWPPGLHAGGTRDSAHISRRLT
jgi:hypothetical protein